jgi:hypothetical protein
MGTSPVGLSSVGPDREARPKGVDPAGPNPRICPGERELSPSILGPHHDGFMTIRISISSRTAHQIIIPLEQRRHLPSRGWNCRHNTGSLSDPDPERDVGGILFGTCTQTCTSACDFYLVKEAFPRYGGVETSARDPTCAECMAGAPAVTGIPAHRDEEKGRNMQRARITRRLAPLVVLAAGAASATAPAGSALSLTHACQSPL